MFSFWEQTAFITKPDVVIIGSGIVGLNAALSLREKSPELKILILERGMLPYGASTRNAGFACYGSASELLEDLSKHSDDEVFSLVEKRYKGLLKLRKLLGDAQIEYEPLGGYEIFRSSDQALFSYCVNLLPKLNGALKNITGIDSIYSIVDEKIQSFGFRNVVHLIENKGEGQLHTGKMMKALLSLCNQKNIEIWNGAVVNAIHENETTIDISLTEGSISCNKVLIATNGFAKRFLPDEDIQAARAQVLITKPIPGLKIKGSFHYDHGYYYFRNVGDRILFGGGRNLDFDKEFTEEFGLTEIVQNKLEELLKDMIIPGIEFETEMRWSGIMGLGKSKTSIIKKVSPHLFCAVRMGGMGVAIGSLVGEEAASLLLSDAG